MTMRSSSPAVRSMMGLLLVAALLVGPARAFAAGAGICTDDLTVGACTDGLEEQVKEIIREAQNAGNEVLLRAAQKLLSALALARIEYKKALDDTLRGVDDTIASNLREGEVAVDRLLEDADPTLDKVSATVNAFVARLPLSKTFPIVEAVEPKFFVLRDGDRQPVSIAVEGSFPTAVLTNKHATLWLGQKEWPVVEQLTLGLRFDVDPSALGASGVSSVSTKYAELRIPWKREGFLWDSEEIARFPVAIGILPKTPGVLTISSWEKNQHYETIDLVEPFSVRLGPKAKDDSGKGRAKVCTEVPLELRKQKFVLFPGSAGAPVFRSGNRARYIPRASCRLDGGASVPDRECFVCTAEGLKNVTHQYELPFRARRDITSTVNFESDRPALTWGEQRLYPDASDPKAKNSFDNREWQGTYVSFDGLRTDFKGSATPSKWIRFIKVRDGIQIHTYPSIR